MDVKIEGGKSFSFLKVSLPPGESIKSEAGAMASMSSSVDLKTQLNGGFLQAVLIKFLGKESLFINTFFNPSSSSAEIALTQTTPGEIVCEEISDETLFLQPGAYIASTEGISFRLSFAGISSFLAGEGLFRIRVYGSGKVWYGAYGAVVHKDVEGEYIVDSGHLLSYPPGMKLKVQLSGGIFSSFFSGEGLVLKLQGKGKIKLQSRSIQGLAGWLNPKFWS